VITPPCVYSRSVFCLAIFLLTIAGCLTLSMDAAAQSAYPYAPSAHRHTPKGDPVTPKFEYVCPGKTLFPDPPEHGPRQSYNNPWEQDYPAVVFDARDGLSYWLDYGPRGSDARLVRFNSLFTPVVATTEKVLVLICGLHFNATASAVPTTVALAAGGPQIDLDAAAGAVPNVAEASGGVAPHLDFDGGGRQQQPPPSDCATLDRAANAAHTVYHEKRKAVQSLLEASGLLEAGSPFSFGQLRADILKATPAPAVRDPQNLTTFKASLASAQGLATRLAKTATSWNALIQGSDFTKAWDALGQALDTAKKAEDDYKKASCPVGVADATNAKIDADVQNFDDLKKELKDATDDLRGARTNLLAAYVALDDWYESSNVSSILILPPVSANSLTQLVVQVSDPWVPG
jgi:hypothetical protein